MTAEFVVAMPALCIVLLACLTSVQLVTLQLRLTDAAADGALLLARSADSAAVERQLTGSLGPIVFEAGRRGDFVCVTVTSTRAIPVLAWFAPTVVGTGCALEPAQ